jgi:hypothetical protein
MMNRGRKINGAIFPAIFLRGFLFKSARMSRQCEQNDGKDSKSGSTNFLQFENLVNFFLQKHENDAEFAFLRAGVEQLLLHTCTSSTNDDVKRKVEDRSEIHSSAATDKNVDDNVLVCS